MADSTTVQISTERRDVLQEYRDKGDYRSYDEAIGALLADSKVVFENDDLNEQVDDHEERLTQQKEEIEMLREGMKRLRDKIE